MDAAVGELDKKVTLSGAFADEWPQVRERWLRCRKMMESSQKRAEEAQGKWRSFENDVTTVEEAVKMLTSQLVQAIENMKNGIKDVSLKDV